MPKGVYPHTHLKPKVYPSEMVDQVRGLYTGGMSQAEVAAELGTSQKVIYTLMRNHGIPRRPQAKRDQWGEKNTAWKGEGAGYQAKHFRVYKRFGPASFHACPCGQQADDWANLTGNYDDPSDFMAMCRSCHRIYDRQGVMPNAR